MELDQKVKLLQLVQEVHDEIQLDRQVTCSDELWRIEI